MNADENRYIEITTRLRSAQSFCEFLAHGGTVRIAQSDGAPFHDVSHRLLQQHRLEVEALKRARRQLFPDRVDDDINPCLYSLN
ncbi:MULTISPECIES: hypothetical protein [unclassified Rhizobium]|uniref:hypothetical protein n=1 Tax=unclassified Rhizobium TaxID=2613769 RepID=UPI0016207F05|nr:MULTISPECIES: hypothetical protein [unclassified Rhizobium]MBB3539334.1 hypothetical protein [Rhizobium sp. BK399]MCS3741276.1 hypothetical protein [Rhizobium sp. BK661]MCS4093440.1 hypothetical protein [Rhizobium sp. BK176]